MAQVVAQVCTGVGDAGAKALIIESKKGVEVCSLDAPQMNHLPLFLSLGQP